MADWTEKYRPTTLSELRGNDTARDELLEWAETWDDHREAAVLHGSPGVGKTSAAHALAADMGWEVMEMNASDDRGGDAVERIAGEASKTSTLDQFEEADPQRKLVVLDEADNLSGTADRGGAAAMTRVVKSASQPIVLIANEFYEMSRGLRNACREIEFRDVSARSIVPALRYVCRQEGIEFDEEALELIAEQTSGDLRSAINDLQAIAEGRERLTVEDVMEGERDRTKGVFEFLEELFQDADAETALQSSYDVDETPPDLIDWIDANVPREYDGAELADAYERLAAADRWLGRVWATQNYTYWRYAGDNMTAGVAAARREPKGGWTRYGTPRWRSGGKTRDEVARKVAEVAGTSVGAARRSILPFLRAMTEYCKPRELTVRMAARYDLDEKEVSFVTGSGESTNKVESIVEEARERRKTAAVEATQGAFAPGPGRAGEDGDREAAEADESDDDAAEPGLDEFADGDPGPEGDHGGTGEGPAGGGDDSDGTDADGADTGGADTGGEDGDGEDTGGEDSDDVDDDDTQSGLGDFM